MALVTPSLGPACAVVGPVAQLLSLNDEGLRYCSSILSIGTVVDPVYSTVTSALAVTQIADVITATTIVDVLASAITSYVTVSTSTVAVTKVVA
jgi:hypothetical protein